MRRGKDRRVRIDLSEDEAVVLWEWLDRLMPNNQTAAPLPGLFLDESERVMLNNLQAVLEKLPITYADNFARRVLEARASLTAGMEPPDELRD